MSYFSDEEPFKRNHTRVLSYDQVKDRVFKISKAMFSKAPTKLSFKMTKELPTISSRRRPTDSVDLIEKIIKSNHKINSKKIQIIRLPKLPFGQHFDYNGEDLFVSNHFIPMEKSENSKEVDEAVRKYRLFENKYSKSQRHKVKFTDKQMPKEKNFVYKTRGGDLVCKRNGVVIDQYEKDADGSKSNAPSRTEFLEEFEEKKNNAKVDSNRGSIDEVIKRLYCTPEPKKQARGDLFTKYSMLFS